MRNRKISVEKLNAIKSKLKSAIPKIKTAITLSKKLLVEGVVQKFGLSANVSGIIGQLESGLNEIESVKDYIKVLDDE
jgi:hypothetical protein